MAPHSSLCRKPLLLLVFAFLTHAASGVSSTDALAGGEDWRPVSPSEITLKTPIVDAGADAEAIFWDIRIDDRGDNDLVLSHYIRIKIFTDRGREKQSSIEIPYLTNTKIKDVAARTIKPDGSILVLSKVDVIEKVVARVGDFKLRTKSFAFPGLENGSIIEYKWKEVISNSSADNMRLQFQRDIPVQTITYHIKPARTSSFFDLHAFNMAAPEFQEEKDGFQFVTVKNAPAFREEPMMPPEDTVRRWGILRYRGLFSRSLGYHLLANQIYNASQPYLKVDSEIKSKSDELVAGATTPEQKLEKLYTFCRANIRNTEEKNSGITAEELEKLKENKNSEETLKRRVGPGIDINLLFAALANAAGFEAFIVLLPDRGVNFFNRNVVINGALRASGIAVRVGETWKFFEPRFRYINPGMLRWQEEGVDGLIAGQSSSWVKTPMSGPEKSRATRNGTFRLDENGTLEGDVKVEYTGHMSVEEKQLSEDESPNQREETTRELVKQRLSTADLTNIAIENVTDPIKPFTYSYHVRVLNYAQRTGKRLFLQPSYFHIGVPALFVSSTRRFPIYFRFPWSEEDTVTITLPKGYAPENADKPAATVAGEVCRYEVKLGITKDQSALVYKRSFFFGGGNNVLFPASGYDQIKKLFDELNKKDNHIITLKQIEVAK